MTGAAPAGVICEIMNDDGSMAKGEQLEKFKETHQLKLISIKQIIEYRHQHDIQVNLRAR